MAERSLMGDVVPARLGRLPHEDDPEDPPQEPGTWKVVLHTIGLKHASGDLQEALRSVPGITGQPWSSERRRIFENPRTGHILGDIDAYAHVGRGSQFELSDPDLMQEERAQFGVRINLEPCPKQLLFGVVWALKCANVQRVWRRLDA